MATNGKTLLLITFDNWYTSNIIPLIHILEHAVPIYFRHSPSKTYLKVPTYFRHSPINTYLRARCPDILLTFSFWFIRFKTRQLVSTICFRISQALKYWYIYYIYIYVNTPVYLLLNINTPVYLLLNINTPVYLLTVYSW